MANRSLFSPFASGVNPYAARGLGSLFGPRLKANPEFLQLLSLPNKQLTNEVLMSAQPFTSSGGLFGSGRRMADLANLQYLAPLIQANFGQNLDIAKAKELEPFRAATELQLYKDKMTSEKQTKDQLREEEESRQGQALGDVAASFPPEQVQNIFGQGASFGSKAEQTRAYIAKFGNMPFNKAIVEADPRVIQARIGEEMGKEYLPLGSRDRFNPRTSQVIEGPSVTEEMIKEMVKTGDTEPYLGPDGELQYRPTYKEQIRTIRRPSPATQYKLPDIVTQEELDSISKPSGANQSGSEPIIVNPPTPEMAQKVLSQLNTNLKQPIQASPATQQYEGLLPTITSHANEAMKSVDPGLHFKKAYEEGLSKLITGKDLAPIGKEVKESVKGIGQTANMFRQAFIKKKGEKDQKVTAKSDPLTLLLTTIDTIGKTTGQTVNEVIEGLRDYIPYYKQNSKPLPNPKKK